MNLDKWAEQIHLIAVEKGFYNRIESLEGIVYEKLLLITTEVAEAVEAFRDHKDEDLRYELADIIIRTLDLVHYLELDDPENSEFEEIVKSKIRKNEERPFLHGRKR